MNVRAVIGVVCLTPAYAPGVLAQADGAGRAIAVQPTLSVGGSVTEFDYAGDRAYSGVALRGGVALGSIVDVTVAGEHWPALGSSGGWALQLEGSLYPLGRRRVAPYVLGHLGYFEAGEGGRTTGLAVGFHARVWDPLGLRLEGLVRYDAGGGDDQLRAFVTYTPGIQRLAAPPAQAAAVILGMVPLSGPWHAISPGYGLQFATGISDRDAMALTVALLHLRIPSPSQPFGAYLWDTRSALLMPGWRHGPIERNIRWYIQAGPAMTLMVEGPDDGLRAGVHAEVGGSVRSAGLPGLTAGVGVVWIVRGASDPSTPSTDERALLFHAGLAF